MNHTSVIFLLDDQIPVRAMRVSYEQSDAHSKNSIKKTLDPDIAVGDFVLVETGTRWGATICKVVAADVEVDLDSDEQVKWIFAKVDLKRRDELIAMEKKLIEAVKEGERRDRKQQLRESLGIVDNKDIRALVAPVIEGERSTPNHQPSSPDDTR